MHDGNDIPAINCFSCLSEMHINIPPTHYILKGCTESLSDMHKMLNWSETVLKPTISGLSRNTLRLTANNIAEADEKTFGEWIKHEDYMLQVFQTSILSKGEISLIMIGGKYSHAVLHQAKPGDFRIQCEFGGTAANYIPEDGEIEFACNVVSRLSPKPVYARIDIMWDNNHELAVSEVELIEPFLWMSYQPDSVGKLSNSLCKVFKNSCCFQLPF